MEDEGASAPGNVDISEIELIVGWLHVNIARLNRKNTCGNSFWSSLSVGKFLKREARRYSMLTKTWLPC